MQWIFFLGVGICLFAELDRVVELLSSLLKFLFLVGIGSSGHLPAARALLNKSSFKTDVTACVQSLSLSLSLSPFEEDVEIMMHSAIITLNSVAYTYTLASLCMFCAAYY